jgi:hypothetical protein
MVVVLVVCPAFSVFAERFTVAAADMVSPLKLLLFDPVRFDPVRFGSVQLCR